MNECNCDQASDLKRRLRHMALLRALDYLRSVEPPAWMSGGEQHRRWRERFQLARKRLAEMSGG